MKITNMEWRTGLDTVGIILCEDEFDKKQRAYLGNCKGLIEKKDAEHIRDWGSKLTFREAKGFFPFIKEENYKT